MKQSNEKVKLVQTRDGKNFLLPFILITSLFFLWGFAHSILDVLNKHFQDALGITRTRSALIQAVVYGGYFLMALPAGNIIRRYGYRAGVLTGLLLYGIGALLFIPGERIMSFEFFLFSLFIIGCGLTCLETAANPYVTVLGEPESAERRINLAQSFNGLGWICGPLAGGLFLFSENGESGSISTPYAIIGVIVLLVALFFSRIRLPEIGMNQPAETEVQTGGEAAGSLWSHRNFTWGLVRPVSLRGSPDGYQQLFHQLRDGACRHHGTGSFAVAVVRRNEHVHGRTHGRKLDHEIHTGRTAAGVLRSGSNSNHDSDSLRQRNVGHRCIFLLLFV